MIMKRGCKYLRHIQQLMANSKSTFDELLQFHQFIHNTNERVDKGAVYI